MHGKRLVFLPALLAVAALSAGSLCYAGPAPADATYVGPAKCKACHPKPYQSYEKNKHATNFAALQGDEKKNPECVKCHTTGFGKPGGFVDEQKTPNLANTTCESCHGPASAHLKVAEATEDAEGVDWKISKLLPDTCVQCHDPHKNFKELAEQARAKK